MVSLSEQQQNDIRGIMTQAAESGSVPALFCGVTDETETIFMHQAGQTVVGDPASPPLDEDAVFWICSQTKLITTIAVLQLVEQGKIQFNTPISQILPELAQPVIVTARDADGKATETTPAKIPITLAHLLNHTSGMEYNLELGTMYGAFPTATRHAYGKDEDSATFFKLNKGSYPGQLLKFEPGTDFAYGFSTDCLGFIVERLSGKSLDQYFKDHIFAPLGITSASFYLTSALKKRLLPLAVRDSEKKLVPWAGQLDIINQDPEKSEKFLRSSLSFSTLQTANVHFGGVGLYCAQKDYLAVVRHLLQVKAAKAENPLLSTASVAQLFEPTLDATAEGSLAKMFGMPAGAAQFSTGLMVTTADFPGRRKKGSGSWAGWACTSYFIDPETGIAAVFGTQLLPQAGFDPAYEMLWIQVEEAIYKGVQK
ncbi:beta-lactamase/transpeptidase-like protein [Mycena crocata]|nr:beta-lactamase/transpeptidase-like protein [Mycena crocata]